MASIPRPASMPRAACRIALVAVVTLLAAVLCAAPPTSTTVAQDAPSGTPGTRPTERPVPLDQGARPVRVRVPALDIDLPVVWSGRTVPGNPAGYPLCDVAQYLVDDARGLTLPGRPGTSWLYGHAQPGMFLPLTLSYFRHGGSELLGQTIELQLRDGRLLTYRVVEVDSGFGYDIAARPNRRQQRLVLQTSTGTSGASPRLMIAGRLVDAAWTDEPRPKPHPRACWQRPESTARTTPRSATVSPRTPEPTPTPNIEPGESLDMLTLLLGSGAILLGATILAVYVVRRP